MAVKRENYEQEFCPSREAFKYKLMKGVKDRFAIKEPLEIDDYHYISSNVISATENPSRLEEHKDISLLISDKKEIEMTER